MKSLLVIGLFLNLIGVVILGMGEVMKGQLLCVLCERATKTLSTMMSSNVRGLPDGSSCWVPNWVRRRAGLGVSPRPIERFR